MYIPHNWQEKTLSYQMKMTPESQAQMAMYSL